MNFSSHDLNILMRHAEMMHTSIDEGMEVVIISTNSPQQALYWQRQLEQSQGQVVRSNGLILTVFEDWPGGAGNGLGTLYAYQKAREVARMRFGIDLLKFQEEGHSIAIYHTAGKGSRLAPLPGSEKNNKSNVKLPGRVFFEGRSRPLTILEAVIRQTALFAPSRKGRLSVFWGDQIFIPSAPCTTAPKHPVDIIACLGAHPNEEEWQKRDLQKYGLITLDNQGNAKQIDKISFSTFQDLTSSGKLSTSGGVGVSLGSFSMSSFFLNALLKEFSEELLHKKGKFDTDPHFWMPLTLDEETYLYVMQKKGGDIHSLKEHYKRMSKFKMAHQLDETPILGALNIGTSSYWWDYGQLKHYVNNHLRLLETHHEAEVMRTFYGLNEKNDQSYSSDQLVVDSRSKLIECNIKKGCIENSLLIGVTAEEINVKNAILINVTAPSISGSDCLLYNVRDHQSLQVVAGTTRADVLSAQAPRHLKLLTTLERDGSQDWNVKLADNHLSYAEVYDLNALEDEGL